MYRFIIYLKETNTELGEVWADHEIIARRIYERLQAVPMWKLEAFRPL